MWRSAAFRGYNHTSVGYSVFTIWRVKTPWPESASELYWPSDRRLSARLVPTFADRRCHVANPYGRILGFIDRSHYFFFQVAPQLWSRGWVDPVPGPLLLRESGRAGNRTRTSGSAARNSDNTTHSIIHVFTFFTTQDFVTWAHRRKFSLNFLLALDNEVQVVCDLEAKHILKRDTSHVMGNFKLSL
jgi:hypothetical protein